MEGTKELSVLEGQFSLAPRNLTEAMEFAKLISTTALVPKSYRDKDNKVNPGDILIAVQMGMEVGLKPLQAIQNIAVINGQPTIWGDALRALCEASGQLEYCVETWDAVKKVATCRLKRKGKPEHTQTFSWEDAIRADLAKKDTYIKFPQRMCAARARGWALRNEFSDILKGLQPREEAMDYEPTLVEGVEIRRPARKSDDLSKQIDEFNKEVGPSKAGAAAPPPPLDRSRLVKVMVQSAVEKNGGGKTFYAMLVQPASGQAFEVTTFDSKLYDAAVLLKGGFALILTKSTESKGKTYINLTHIEAAPSEEPAESAPVGEREAGMEG